MAEAYLRFFCEKENIDAEIFSAGIEAHGVNPKVIEVLKEDNLDISLHTSNKIEEYLNTGITHVLTVCDHANEYCPIFPQKVKISHHNFIDPTKVEGSAETINKAFKKTREEIKAYCNKYLTHKFKNEC
jgi:arsenate reductase